MSRAWAIYRREIAYFFNSPVAYAVITVFLLISGYIFYYLLARFNQLSVQLMQNPVAAMQMSLTQGVIQPLFGNISMILVLMLPLLTMHLLSEERRSGTAELLFTFPISDWDAILGKYFATATVFAVMLAMTFVYPALLRHYASPEFGPVVSGYIGLLLMGLAFIAMGMFFSSLGDNQLVAGVTTFGCGLAFLVVGWIVPFVSTDAAKVLSQLSILEHLNGFAKGAVDTNDVVFYLNFIALFLFLCSRVLDSNRWRG